ncbi:MAG: SseB family protein [Actinomycetota bacterium]
MKDPDSARGGTPPAGQPSADSAGLAWSGRTLTSTGFEGDLGAADPALLAVLDDPGDETLLMQAVAQARLLVPIVAVPPEADHLHERPDEPTAGESAPSTRTGSGATDMAVMILTASDGRRAFPVFSSLAALSAWDATARPFPVGSFRAAQGAVSEGCDVMLLDCGSARERVLRPSMVWALAQQRDWLPAYLDPFVAQALVWATCDEDDVTGCVGQDDPAEPGTLRVVLSLRPGLDAGRVQSLATRIGERIATDGEARARIDALSFTIRQA